MQLKKLLKPAIFVGTLVAGLTATICFGINADAATYNYSDRCITSKGKSDYGIRNGKVINIKDFYDEYVSANSVTSWVSNERTSWKSNVTYYSKNNYFDNYSVSGVGPLDSQINIYDDDPICAFVDKTCFKNEGDFFLMGDEYGYFVHTERQDEFATHSTVLLFDIVYDWEYDSLSNSTKQTVKLEVVSQTGVCTLNFYALCLNNYKSYAVDHVSESNPKSKTRQIYNFSLNNYPYDGYITCPVLKESWRGSSDGRTYTGVSAVLVQYKYLYLTDITYDAKYTTSNGVSYFNNAIIEINNARSLKFRVNPDWGTRVKYAFKDISAPIFDYFDGKCADKLSEALDASTKLGKAIPILNTVVSGVKDIRDSRRESFAELYPACFDETPINTPPTVSANYYLSYPANDAINKSSTNENYKYLVIGQNEGDAASVAYTTYFSGKNTCYTDSVLMASPVIWTKEKSWDGLIKDDAVRPENVINMEDIYGAEAKASSRHMCFADECSVMNNITYIGNAAQFSKTIETAGTTPYVVEFNAPTSAEYSIGLKSKLDNYSRVVIWNKNTKKVAYVSDYSNSISPLVYLSSGDYYMEFTLRIDYTAINNLDKRINQLREEVRVLNDKIKSRSEDKNNNSFSAAYMSDEGIVIAFSSNPSINKLIMQRDAKIDKINELLEERKNLLKNNNKITLSATRIYIPIC